MKKSLSSILAILLVFVFAFLAIASGESEEPATTAPIIDYSVSIQDEPPTVGIVTEPPTTHPYEYLRGEYGQVVGNKYIDGKANVMFDITSEFPNGDQSVYDQFLSASQVSGSMVTFASYNSTTARTLIVGYETGSTFSGMSASEFISNQKEALANQLAYTNPLTFNGTTSMTVAGETYACMQGQYQTGQHYYMCARVVDGVIFNFAVIAENETVINNFFNSITTVY